MASLQFSHSQPGPDSISAVLNSCINWRALDSSLSSATQSCGLHSLSGTSPERPIMSSFLMRQGIPSCSSMDLSCVRETKSPASESFFIPIPVQILCLCTGKVQFGKVNWLLSHLDTFLGRMRELRGACVDLAAVSRFLSMHVEDGILSGRAGRFPAPAADDAWAGGQHRRLPVGARRIATPLAQLSARECSRLLLRRLFVVRLRG